MPKSKDAFRTISEVSEWLDTPAHVLRFWESKFSQVKPVKRAGGRRYYRPDDMLLLGGIKTLLHSEGMTIKGVQKLLREKGVAHVAAQGPALDNGEADDVVDVSLTPVAETPPPAMPPDHVDETSDNVVNFAVVADADPSPSPVKSFDLSHIQADPDDEDFNPPSRFFAALLRADPDRLEAQAAALRPLISRLEAVSASLSKD